ncbi:hypothetical protein [Pseudoalteromonas maricaloris]
MNNANFLRAMALVTAVASLPIAAQHKPLPPPPPGQPQPSSALDDELSQIMRARGITGRVAGAQQLPRISESHCSARHAVIF